MVDGYYMTHFIDVDLLEDDGSHFMFTSMFWYNLGAEGVHGEVCRRCEHFCPTSVGGTSVCSCKPGYRLKSDKRHCKRKLIHRMVMVNTVSIHSHSLILYYCLVIFTFLEYAKYIFSVLPTFCEGKVCMSSLHGNFLLSRVLWLSLYNQGHHNKMLYITKDRDLIIANYLVLKSTTGSLDWQTSLLRLFHCWQFVELSLLIRFVLLFSPLALISGSTTFLKG